MKKGKRWPWIMILVLGLFAICGGLFYLEREPVLAFEQFKQEIETDLPFGTARADVEKWFRDRDISYWDIMDGEKNVCGLGTIIPQQSFWENAQIRINFYFDKSNKLQQRIVSRFVFDL